MSTDRGERAESMRGGVRLSAATAIAPVFTPDRRICERARLSRDPRFDGLFFFAVTSTGIYCRPVCPKSSPKRENIRYYPTSAAAAADGFRPCLRCCPELPAPASWRRGDAAVTRALELIEDGFLADYPLAALAARVGVGERQLRRRFTQRLGTTPPRVHDAQRLTFAKKLLAETSLPILDVALESGFSSVRRFNARFRDAYGLTPSTVRKEPQRAAGRDQALELRLDVRPPYDLRAILDFLRPRALAGVEEVGVAHYLRAFGPPEAPGWLRVSAWPDNADALRLEVHCRRPSRMLEIVTRVRRMFDLDADPRAINASLSADPWLRPLVAAAPGLRLPGAWSGFEAAVRGVLAQPGGDAVGRVAARVLERYGYPLEPSSGFAAARLFPGPEALVNADLAAVGADEESAATVRRVARALLDGQIDFRAEATLEEFVGRWSAVPGVGCQTAHEVALWALGHPDAFPADRVPLDTRVGHVVADATGPREVALSGEAALPVSRFATARAERWRPWRAYALVHLWRGATRSRATTRRPWQPYTFSPPPMSKRAAG